MKEVVEVEEKEDTGRILILQNLNQSVTLKTDFKGEDINYLVKTAKDLIKFLNDLDKHD